MAHSLCRAKIPASKEPLGLTRSDGKRPDGITHNNNNNNNNNIIDKKLTEVSGDPIETSYLFQRLSLFR